MFAVRILPIEICKQTQGSGVCEMENRQNGQCNVKDKETVRAGFIGRRGVDVEHRHVDWEYEREFGLTSLDYHKVRVRSGVLACRIIDRPAHGLGVVTTSLR